MADDQLSPQDLQDLQMVRTKMGDNHPKAAALDALLTANHANNRQPTQFEKDRSGANAPGQSGFGMNFLKSAGHAIGNLVSAPGAAITALSNPASIPVAVASTIGNVMNNDQQRKNTGRSGLYRTAAAVSDLTGIGNAPQMEQAADTGNTAGIAGMGLGSAAGNIAAPIMVGGALKAIPKVMGRVPSPVELSPTESSSRTLATRLTNSAKEAPGVSSTLSNQLDTIKRTVPSISPKQGLLDLSKAAQTAAENDKYLSNVIEPHKDLPTASGQTVGEAHGELAKLNAELYPKFNRGGAGSPTAQATIESGKAAELNARAEQLRNEIADAVGKKTGVDPAYIKGLRRNYEQLNDIAWRADVSDYAHRMGLRDPAIPTSRMGLIERGLSKLPFNNPNAAVAKTFNSYEAAPEAEVPGMKLTGPDLFKPQVQHPVISHNGTNVELPPRLNPGIDAEFNPRIKQIPPPAREAVQHPVITSNPELPRLFDVVDNSAASKAYLEGLAKKRANVKPIGGKE